MNIREHPGWMEDMGMAGPHSALKAGIDCASPLSAEAAARAYAAGYRFAGRYLVPAEGSLKWKALTATEAHSISAAGLGLLCCWETSANRARGDGTPAGAAGAGAVDGMRAKLCARDIAMPERGIIYFAVDYPAPEADYPLIGAYMNAAAQAVAPYRLGVYGSYFTVEAMAMRGVGAAFWQCVAWSQGKQSPHMNAYQRFWQTHEYAKQAAAQIGVGVDISTCGNLRTAGIWRYEEDNRMEIETFLDAITPEQAARLVGKAQAHFAEQPLPGTWSAGAELREAKAREITDGSNPMLLVTRLEAAVMAKRALLAAEGKPVKPAAATAAAGVSRSAAAPDFGADEDSRDCSGLLEED